MRNLTIGIMNIEPFLFWSEHAEFPISSLPAFMDLVWAYKRYNCRCLAKFVTDESKLGTYQEGTYVGLLGMLHRKEVDTLLFPVPFDIKNPPGSFLSVAREEKAHILSPASEVSRRDAHVLEMVPSIDWNVYCLLIINGFLLNGFLGFFEKKPRMFKKEAFFKYAWDLFAAHYHQTTCKFISVRSNILYLINCFMYFFLLVHITLLFSTNMVIETKDNKAETLKDLIDLNKDPIFIKGRPVTEYVLKANSEEASLLRNKMKIKGYGWHIAKFDPFEIIPLAEIIENKAFIGEKVWILYIMRYLKWTASLGLQNHVIDKPHISPNPVHKTLEGFIHNFKKEDTPSCLIHGTYNMFENGLTSRLYADIAKSLLPLKWEDEHECEMKISKSFEKILRLDQFFSLMELYCFSMITSLFLVLIERFVAKLQTDKKLRFKVPLKTYFGSQC